MHPSNCSPWDQVQQQQQQQQPAGEARAPQAPAGTAQPGQGINIAAVQKQITPPGQTQPPAAQQTQQIQQIQQIQPAAVEAIGEGQCTLVGMVKAASWIGQQKRF